MDQHESQWIAQCQAGDRAAFDSLYAAQAPRVWAYLRRVGFTHTDADDLTQETFLRAFHSIRTFDAARGTFRQWLAAIARNVARRRWKRRKTPEHVDAELAEAVLVASDNPTETAEAREQTSALADCIETLPPDLARLVRLRYVDAKTTRGIAKIVHMPEATVRLRLDEAVAALTQCLGKKGMMP